MCPTSSDSQVATASAHGGFSTWLVSGGAAAPSIMAVTALWVADLAEFHMLQGGWLLFYLTILCIAVIGFLCGTLGGIGLAIARKNPLWLLATLAALLGGFYCYMLTLAFAMSGVH